MNLFKKICVASETRLLGEEFTVKDVQDVVKKDDGVSVYSDRSIKSILWLKANVPNSNSPDIYTEKNVHGRVERYSFKPFR